MQEARLIKDFDYLAETMGSGAAHKRIIFDILERLIRSDAQRKTKFEYSLQIENKRLINSFRFVNFDTIYKPSESHCYLKRLDTVKDVAELCIGRKKIISKYIDIIKKYSSYRLPVFIGVEFNGGEVYCKLYLNFYVLYARNERMIKEKIKQVIGEFNKELKIDMEKVNLFNVVIDQDGKPQNYKLYCFYDKNKALDKDGFSDRDIRIFNWLNKRNRLGYYAITKRYAGPDLDSKKIEVHPKNEAGMIAQLCEKTADNTVYKQMKEIIKNTNGELEVVSVESGNLTFYMNMLDYDGRRKSG